MKGEMKLERFDLWFKGAITTVGTLFSIISSGLGLSFTILLVMQATDYLTGLIAAGVNKELSSKVGFKGLAKKMYVIILVGVVYFLEYYMFGTTYVADGVCVAYIVMELISITENGGKMGAPIPSKVSNLIEMLKSKGDSNENHR